MAGASGLTLSVAAALTTCPAVLPTSTENDAPASAIAALAMSKVLAVAPVIATPLRRHW